jgi:tetratricopeptide (TPR) repeat protein
MELKAASAAPIASGGVQPKPAPPQAPGGGTTGGVIIGRGTVLPPPAGLPGPGTGTPSPATPPSAVNARARDLTDRYNRAQGAVEGGAFATAIPILEQLQRDEPNYRDVPALLARAREGLGANAKQALASGSKLEASGDLPGALQQYERARQLDPSVAPAADQAVARLRARMTKEGTAAYTSGRQYDALDRLEQAIAQYERAVRLLSDDDPNKKIANDRLAVLRARR